MKDFDLHPFDPGTHGAFVYDSFRRSMADLWPWAALPRPTLMDRLRREMASPGTVTRVVTPLRTPGDFLGWVSVRPRSNAIVFAFVKYPARRLGVGAGACMDLGVRFVDEAGKPQPVPVVFWTAASARIRQRTGFEGLFFDLRDAYEERRI